MVNKDLAPVEMPKEEFFETQTISHAGGKYSCEMETVDLNSNSSRSSRSPKHKQKSSAQKISLRLKSMSNLITRYPLVRLYSP